MMTDDDGDYDLGSRWLRLETAVRLRWLAVAGQLATLALVGFALGFPLRIAESAALVAMLAGINLWLQIRFPASHRLGPGASFFLLGFDLMQLCGLLFVNGGLVNPFAPLVCVPVIIASASLPLRHSVGLGGLAVLLVTALAFSPFSLPWYPQSEIKLQPEMMIGIWFAIICTMSFAGFYTYRVSHEAHQLADALAATELVLEREKHLSQLDGLAAAAAHELGTPLATISVVAKEMQRAIKPDDPLAEDIALLIGQSGRCRDILKRLTTLSGEPEAHMNRLPLTSLIEEVIAPHRDFGIRLDVGIRSDGEREPVGTRNPGIVYGLGNLIENAVDYARESVSIAVFHDRQEVRITISDDGEGFSPDVLARIGEPYMTRRFGASKAGGLGLGLFIAKTLLERSGASLAFGNRKDGAGAEVSVSWPRWRMDSEQAGSTFRKG